MSRKILLADDSLTIQKVVELTFMEGDFEVAAVSNGDDALTKLGEGVVTVAHRSDLEFAFHEGQLHHLLDGQAVVGQ